MRRFLSIFMIVLISLYSFPQTNTSPPQTNKGGKNDIDAIGCNNRGIGSDHKSLGNWYSLEKEIGMGKGYAQMVEANAKLIQDPIVTEYVNRIGQNLVRNSDACVPFTIKVIDDDSINAFALPGGFFYVNVGLILAADEESELAGVMAHEIAHVAARHATRQMTRGNWVHLASIPLVFVPMGAAVYYGTQAAASLGLPLTFTKFERDFEGEADFLGLEYMYKTGYDPQAFINFFEKVKAKEKKKPGTLAKAFASHPPTEDRMADLQKEMETVLPPRDQYVVSTDEFNSVKARLAALINKRKIPNDQTNKPTLRKSSSNDKTDGKDDKDDKPTLKRRDQ